MTEIGERNLLYEKMLSICAIYDCSITSCYRTKERNKIVHGHPKSLHMQGLAIDIVPDDWENTEKITNAIKILGLHYLVEKTHIHIQSRGISDGNT